jgi:hypothetical protein
MPSSNWSHSSVSAPLVFSSATASISAVVGLVGTRQPFSYALISFPDTWAMAPS